LDKRESRPVLLVLLMTTREMLTLVLATVSFMCGRLRTENCLLLFLHIRVDSLVL